MVIFSKKSPPELERGLLLIKKLKDEMKSLEDFKFKAPH